MSGLRPPFKTMSEDLTEHTLGTRIAECQAENERLRNALMHVRDMLYGSYSAFMLTQQQIYVRPKRDEEPHHPSACSYRVEAIEACAEVIECALNQDTEDSHA